MNIIYIENKKFSNLCRHIRLDILMCKIKDHVINDKPMTVIDLPHEYTIFNTKNSTEVRYDGSVVLSIKKTSLLKESLKDLYRYLFHKKNIVTNINKIPLTYAVAIISFIKENKNLKISEDLIHILVKSKNGNLYEILITNELYNIYKTKN